MQKLLSLLKKLNTPPVYSTLLIILGALFILLPEAVLDIFIIVVGILLVSVSLVHLTATVSDNSKARLSGELIVGIIVGICGVALIAMKSAVSYLFCRILGLLIGAYSFARLMRHSSKNKSRDKSFWLTASLYICAIIVGIWLAFFPLWPKIMTGIAMLILAGKLIFDEIEKHKDSHGKMENGNYYTDDFEDKS